MLTVILNTASGSAANESLPAQLAGLFRAEGVEARILPLQRSRDISALVGEALDAQSDAIVAAGGDGTVSSVAALLVGKDTPLGVLPLGTLNHFAKDLRIPVDLAGAVKTIVAGHSVPVDIATVNDRIFLNNSSIGIYPSVVEAREALRRQGHRKWTALAIATFRILPGAREVFVRLDANGVKTVMRTPFVFIGNNEYVVEGPSLGGRLRVDGGRLYAYIAPRLHNRDLPKLFLWALAGRARSRKAFETFSSTELWIETPHSRLIPVSTDGEVTMMVTPLHYQTYPGALRVLAPAG